MSGYYLARFDNKRDNILMIAYHRIFVSNHKNLYNDAFVQAL